MTPAVEVKGLRKSYGQIEAVRGIDLSVGQGEIFGFLGPNGAGKTTTISVLCTLVRKNAGEARIAGSRSTRIRARSGAGSDSSSRTRRSMTS